MKLTFIRSLIVILLLMPACISLAQVPSDTTKSTKAARKKKSMTRKAYDQGLKSITVRQKKDTVKNESSTKANAKYEGKIIRNIYVQSVDLKRSIYDSTKQTKKFVTDIADALHGSTRESVIRNHLFFEKNRPLNPHELADNERYLRDLDFILDSRILASSVPGSDDSVDVTITTRDVFSLGIRVGGTIPTSPEIGIYDANFLGRGQRLDFTGLLDQDRVPKFGYSASYRKSSVLGSLASLEFAYTQLNDGRSYGKETEFAYIIRASRPLVSPYSRLAGGFEFSNNWSENVYPKDDTTAFLNYSNKISDMWLGYNIGIRKEASNRNRHFLSVRYFDLFFMDQPDQEEYQSARKYNNITGQLSQYTFYRQNYYKTQYVFGFGRTEDIPYGLSLSVTGGYVRQLSLTRPYAGAQGIVSFANRKGNFYIFNAQTGTYFRDQKLEDAVVSTSVTYVTRALNVLHTHKLRAFFQVGYAQLFNRRIADYIEIDDSEITGFDADSVEGSSKARARMEVSLYTPWQLFGFRFAPFLGIDNALLDCAYCGDEGRVNIMGFTGGFRTRNENLIFGTMEVRFNYIPSNPATSSQFSFEFKQRLKVKNSGSFVKPPKLVQY